MLLTVIFLITCIVTARLLEKKKMRVASIAYSVMFIIFLSALVFVSDFSFIRDILTDVFGTYAYYSARYIVIEAVDAPGYSIIISVALVLTVVFQIAATVYCFVDTIVSYLKKKHHDHKKWKEALKRTLPAYDAIITKRINILYCRMLN